jgi:hypothetical protein
MQCVALHRKPPAATLTPVPSPQGRGERRHRSSCENIGRGGGAARSPLSLRGEGSGVRGADAELCGIKINHPAPTLTPVPSPQGRGVRRHHSPCENIGRGGDATQSPLSLRGEGPGVRGTDAELCGIKSNRPAATLTPVPSPQGRGERRHRSRCENNGGREATGITPGAKPLAGEGMQHDLPSPSRRGAVQT